MRRQIRTVTPIRPTAVDVHHGLAYSLWMPPGDRQAHAGVVILHGAGSGKESHHDFARATLTSGFAAISLDLRGHGSSEGPLDGGVVDDITRIVSLLRECAGNPELPVALRGSSMGGYLAIIAAQAAGADAIVAICPPSAEGLRRGVRSRRFTFAANVASLERFLSSHELYDALESLPTPLLLLHAEGDEQVPVEHSRELAKRASHPESRLITVPGGHHRSIQHDPDLQAVSLRWLARVLSQTA